MTRRMRWNDDFKKTNLLTVAGLFHVLEHRSLVFGRLLGYANLHAYPQIKLKLNLYLSMKVLAVSTLKH